MTTVTSSSRSSVLDGYHGEGPKWRLEHASTGQAVCQQAACKRGRIKIEKGEVRIGTNTLFDREEEQRWNIAWRHWACATKFQIMGLKEVTENDAAKAPGFDRLSSEAQEQVQLAFENDGIVDKSFKGKSVELAKGARRYHGEFTNATGYKVDVGKRCTSCRNADCSAGGAKIAKGELRLGISVPFDGEHESWVYKHWKCMSQFDLGAILECYEQDSLDIHDSIADGLQMVVTNTLESRVIVEPPEISEAPARPVPRKTAKKQITTDDESEVEVLAKTEIDDETMFTPKTELKAKPKTQPKGKGKGKRRVSTLMESDSEAEYVPRKTRSRAVPMEEAGN